jgi:hypothetical protein
MWTWNARSAFRLLVAWSFDVVVVMHTFTALLIGKVQLVVVTVIGPIKQKKVD